MVFAVSTIPVSKPRMNRWVLRLFVDWLFRGGVVPIRDKLALAASVHPTTIQPVLVLGGDWWRAHTQKHPGFLGGSLVLGGMTERGAFSFCLFRRLGQALYHLLPPAWKITPACFFC